MAATSPAPNPQDKPNRKLTIAAWIVFVLLHLILTAHSELYSPMWSDQPMSSVDFDTHSAQVQRVAEALDTWGKHWAYDPQLLAGFPEGTVFDTENKGWELWCFGLWKLGIPLPIAFNLFVLFVHLIVPWTVYVSARLFRLKSWEGLLAATLCLGLWFFDGQQRWSWFGGAVSFAFVAAAFVLPIALFYAHLHSNRKWLLVPLAVVMSIGHLIHPSTFVLLVVPMASMYIKHFRRLTWKQHASIASVAIVVIGSNAWWLYTAFRFVHYVTDHQPFFVGKITDIFVDAAGLVNDVYRTGLIGNRTGFRFLACIAAIMTLVLWRKDRDDRFLPLALGIGFLLAMAYLGGYFWVFRQIQQYRSATAAAFLACIPAAAFVGELHRRRTLHQLPKLAWAPFGLCAFMGASYLAHDVMYFFPRLIPKVPPLRTGENVPMSAFGFPPHGDYRHFPPDRFILETADWVNANNDGQGRFLVESWSIGEFLLSRTKAQILGGFRERNLDHNAANLFRHSPKGDLPQEDLEKYLTQYAVQWIIVTSLIPTLESSPLLEFKHRIGPHRIYKTQIPVSLVHEGTGNVKASLNRIDVTESDPNQNVVLRYHWLETLVCEPDCKVERAHLDDNLVGFIRIPAKHPESFSIINRY